MLLFISHAPQKHLFWKYVRMHLKSHTSQLYSRWQTICEQNSMSGITLFIKQLAKSLWMTHYFRQDSEVCIWWTLFYPMSPQRGFVNGRKATHLTQVGYMTMTTWQMENVPITFILYTVNHIEQPFLLVSTLLLVQNMCTVREYVISDAAHLYGYPL